MFHLYSCHIRSIAIKEEAKYVKFWKKKRIKGEKYITPMDFEEHLRKSDVSENSKVYYSRLLQNGLYERYCYSSKCRWEGQYLKSASHCLLVERWRWNCMIKVYYDPPLLRGMLHLIRGTAVEKEFHIAI